MHMPVHVPTRVLLAPRSSAVLINEVTNQGSETDLCAGEDWVELVNVVGAPSSVVGMALDDSSSSPDLGIVSDLPAEVAAGKALVLGQGSCPAEIPAHGHLVVCKGEKAFTFDAAGAVVAVGRRLFRPAHR